MESQIKSRRIEGFKEFSNNCKIQTDNFQFGCSNNCVYCHQKIRHQFRFKKGDWNTIQIRNEEMDKGWRGDKSNIILQIGTVSDIIPENIDQYIKRIKIDLKENWKEIQITTKANYRLIRKIMDAVGRDIEKLHFFITITTNDNDLIHFWEGNAPNFQSRTNSLMELKIMGAKTTLLCEPMLSDPREFINNLSDFVTDDIWIGKMNYIGQLKHFYPKYALYLDNLNNWYDNNFEKISSDLLQSNPKVKLKH